MSTIVSKLAGAAILVGLLLASGGVRAQEVTCESKDNRRVECPMNTRGEVRMVRQLSRTACTEGVTWGLNKHSIWVEGGCRAVFKNMSPIQEPAAGGNRVVCESANNQRVECDMNTSGEVRMVRQLSKSACTEGTTWGLNRHSIWVDRGCRAEFQNVSASGRPNNAASLRGPTGGQLAACNRRLGANGSVESSTALNPGAWEIILVSNGRRYACDVGTNNQVDGFQELR